MISEFIFVSSIDWHCLVLKTKENVCVLPCSLESNLFVQSDIHDIVNPLTWDNLPEIVRKSCPKWKDEELSRSYSEGIDSPRPSDGDGDDIASFKTESPVPFSPSGKKECLRLVCC